MSRPLKFLHNERGRTGGSTTFKLSRWVTPPMIAVDIIILRMHCCSTPVLCRCCCWCSFHFQEIFSRTFFVNFFPSFVSSYCVFSNFQDQQLFMLYCQSNLIVWKKGQINRSWNVGWWLFVFRGHGPHERNARSNKPWQGGFFRGRDPQKDHLAPRQSFLSGKTKQIVCLICSANAKPLKKLTIPPPVKSSYSVSNSRRYLRCLLEQYQIQKFHFFFLFIFFIGFFLVWIIIKCNRRALLYFCINL